jgi:hypothetical protein
VSRVRNADESLMRFRKARADYECSYKPRLGEIRAMYSNNPADMVPPAIDESLETHSRVYLVNAMLSALNWRLDCSPEEGLPNLVPESPDASVLKGTRRFLDYLGLERDIQKPLLIVETKRPRSLLPQIREPVLKNEYGPSVNYLPFVIRDGLRGAKLTGKWNEWLDTLSDYVRSVREQSNHTPQRVVITNGDWLILFADPADAFLLNGVPDPANILVWENRDDIEDRYSELFQWLEHFSVLREAPPLTVGELSFHLEPEALDYAMNGLRLLYIERPGLYRVSPIIEVVPILFIHSSFGAWLYVDRRSEKHVFEIPHKYDDLPKHLDKVRASAESLLHEVNSALGTALTPLQLIDHYRDHESLVDLPGVVEIGYFSGTASTQYLIATGSQTHYFLLEASVKGCPHHDWFECQRDGVESNPGPVTGRSVENPKAFFTSTELHHCAHREAANAKASKVTAENRDRCGPRSGRNGQAFCEIMRFEEHLCCRTCAFEEVCTRAQVFQLPCGHLEVSS